MKALITGGAGFIGSHLVEELNKRHIFCAVVDDLSKGSEKNLRGSKYDFFKLNICSPNLSSVIKKIKPDLIFHLAAQTNIALSNKKPDLDLKINLLGTLNLLNSLKKAPPEKLIFASSSAVYGNSIRFPIREDSPKRPFSVYGISKYSSELSISNWAKEYSISHAIMRFSNVYGEKQDSSAEGGVVSIFINNLLKGVPVAVFGNGGQTRDFIYVKDVISAILKSMDMGIAGIFNVSTSNETSINKLLDLLEGITQKKAKRLYSKRKFIEVEKSIISYAKLLKETKWNPKTKLKDGLEKTYEYFKTGLKR